jgi:hypothetical protein
MNPHPHPHFFDADPQHCYQGNRDNYLPVELGKIVSIDISPYRWDIKME